MSTHQAKTDAPVSMRGPRVVPPAPSSDTIRVAPPVRIARMMMRHRIVAFSFAGFVLAPVLCVALYFWIFAASQYASFVSFSIRSENQSSPLEVLGGLSALAGTSSSSDSEVLYAFFQSQDMVDRIDKDVGLQAMWSKPSFDPVFSYHTSGTIEDLTDFWKDMVQISFDASTGIIDIRVLAFDPADAQRIAEAISSEGTDMINKLSDIARDDAIRYAREDLDVALGELREARAAVSRFRNQNQIVDPSLDTAGQMGILNTLQNELASAMVDLDMLRQTTRSSDDIRISQAEARISVIQKRIAEERGKLGMEVDADGASVYADLVGDYERLTVDREFAEQSYTAALASFNSARAEAGRQSRYLAAHVEPTLAQKSQYPQRGANLALIALFLFLVWGVAILLGYSLKDRR